MNELTPKARALILEFEGVDQPSDWPGGASGITVGYGYDLGYTTFEQFRAAWKEHLTAYDFKLLVAAVGRTGKRAKAIAEQFSGIKITPEAALAVFEKVTVPKTFAECRKALPGFDALPADAQGALVSLVYNRGASMGKPGADSWDKRHEMREVRDAVAAGDLHAIAQAVLNMRRLWVWWEEEAKWRALIEYDRELHIIRPPDRPMRGLQRRREAEAKLVEESQP